MKICWNNLEKLKYSKRTGNWYKKNQTYIYKEKCKKCGSGKSLHCHHIEGIRWEPLESADMDKVTTLCKKCHKEVHKLSDCGYHDQKCKKYGVI